MDDNIQSTKFNGVVNFDDAFNSILVYTLHTHGVQSTEEISSAIFRR